MTTLAGPNRVVPARWSATASSPAAVADASRPTVQPTAPRPTVAWTQGQQGDDQDHPRDRCSLNRAHETSVLDQ